MAQPEWSCLAPGDVNAQNPKVEDGPICPGYASVLFGYQRRVLNSAACAPGTSTVTASMILPGQRQADRCISMFRLATRMFPTFRWFFNRSPRLRARFCSKENAVKGRCVSSDIGSGNQDRLRRESRTVACPVCTTTYCAFGDLPAGFELSRTLSSSGRPVVDRAT